MGDNRRILIATIASMVILFAWQKWMMPPAKPRPTPAAKSEPSAAPSPTPSPAPSVGASAAPVPVPADAPEERVVLETPEFRAEVTTRGGALASLTLKGHKFQRDEKGNAVPIDLVRVAPGQPLPLSMVAGPDLGGTGRAADDPAAHAPMRIASQDAKSVTFEGSVGGATVQKRIYVTGKPYELGLDLEVRAPRNGTLGLVYSGYVSPDAPKPGFFSGGAVAEAVTPICRAAGKTVRAKDEAVQQVAGTPRWMGLDQHYFVSAVLPASETGECVFERGPTAGAVESVLRIPVNGETKASFRVYSGPKQIDLLQAYARELDTAVDYGAVTNLFAFFARMLLWVMRQLEAVVANWGVAIILLTFLVKLVLYPLTAKSMQSMNEMRKLQPEIEKLKAKHGDDREKMNLAVMQLYREHKVNPLGGCLPMLLQMPIWFALYATLQTSVELYREPFLWIKDLTHYDPYYVLPLAMGASSFIMQRLSPQPADNTQAKMLLYFMPVFFTFIMLKLPAGLTLYILVNNLLSIAQQQWLMRRSAAPAPAETA
ncbi:MAG TPA: membrane protein insertase YidC [Anaeromyxobacteraceae bacterium]|nr:membrane protein insertase YidC [Anaeromyxobacteraceae bacterium]